MSPKDWLELAGGVLALATFVFALVQYRREQQWRRVEFLVDAVKEFEESWGVKNIMQILDGEDLEMELRPDAADPAKRKLVVTDDFFVAALPQYGDNYEIEGDRATEKIAIRESLDDFLTRLDRFNSHIETGLIPMKAVDVYIGYWIRALAGHGTVEKPQELIQRMWMYADMCDYKGTQRLCARYGFSIKPKSAPEKTRLGVNSSPRQRPIPGSPDDKRDSCRAWASPLL